MFKSILYLAVDTQLGRVDRSSLSDQILIEMLVQGFTGIAKGRYQDKFGVFIDVCEWCGVDCDAENRVTAVYDIEFTAGEISLSHIPPKVESFEMYSKNLTGTLEAGDLPQCLETFDISGNAFDGTVDFQNLPRALAHFDINTNAFTGSADLTTLPHSLRVLWMHANRFSGELCLSSPPQRLNHINLSANAFSGDFCLPNPPKTLVSFGASKNNFNTIAVVSKRFTVFFKDSSGVAAVVDGSGDAHAKTERMLCP